MTREIYMDDGTWARKGDKCLPASPLRHGTVLRRDNVTDSVWVKWDDGKIEAYLDHGINAELPNEKVSHAAPTTT